MSRLDIPSEAAGNFSSRVRETIQTMLGVRGDKLDRVVTLRDLIDNELFTVRPGTSVGTGTVSLQPGSSLPQLDEPDLTPPPPPGTLTATGAISHILIEVPAATYTQGHGHLRTRVYGANPTTAVPNPTFSDAVELGQFSGTVWALNSNPSTSWRLWAKWESNDGVLSATPTGGANGVSATTGADVSSLVKAMTGAGNPFTILTAPTVIGGVTFPAGTYSTQAFILDAQITNAKIANAAIDDAKVANLSAGKLTAGSIAVGQFIQSTGYVAGSAGWRINGDGVAEFSGVVVRGTVFASAGLIGGITIASNAVRAGQTDFNTGNGFHLGADGRFSLGNATGNRLTWDGTNLNVVGGGTFSGALSAATGTFVGNVSAGQFTTGSITGYAWPPVGAGNFGTYLGPSGLLIGNANNNKYFQVEASGNIYAPGFSVVNGAMTINQVDVIDTLNLRGNAVVLQLSAFVAGSSILGGTASMITLTFNCVGQKVLVVFSGELSFSPIDVGASGSAIINLLRNGTTLDSRSAGMSSAGGVFATFAYTDTPPAGSVTYQITASGGGPNMQVNLAKKTLITMETKR